MVIGIVPEHLWTDLTEGRGKSWEKQAEALRQRLETAAQAGRKV